MRKVIIYLHHIYDGDWDRILYHMDQKKGVDLNGVEEYYNSIDSEKLLTMIDDDYPKKYKSLEKPPFVVRKDDKNGRI